MSSANSGGLHKYEKKRKEHRAKQKEITKKIGKLFESSEPEEKWLLLKMTLQNLKLRGKKVRYDWIKPFDKVAFYASRQSWLPRVDSNHEPAG